MLERTPSSKDEALEAIDFIVNVLKEHEKDLDKLIHELANVTDHLGDNGQINGKLEKVEEKIDNLQKEVTKLNTYLSNIQKESPSKAVKEEAALAAAATMIQSEVSIILRCTQWEDFLTLAFQARMLSFSYGEETKVFQADALKGSQIITYVGVIPKFSAILKTWLSKELDIPGTSIVEGVIAIK